MSTHVEAFLEGGPHDGETRVIDDRVWEWDPEVECWAGVYVRSAGSPVWTWAHDCEGGRVGRF